MNEIPHNFAWPDPDDEIRGWNLRNIIPLIR